MTNPIPIARSYRYSEIISVSEEQTVFDITAFKNWDVEDVHVLFALSGSDRFVAETLFNAQKINDDVFDYMRVTFNTAFNVGDRVVFFSKRLHERLGSVTQGGVINSIALERELDRVSTVLQELRRDSDRAVKAPFGSAGLEIDGDLEVGDTLMLSEEGILGSGPNAEDIANAQGYAERAESASYAAVAASSSLASLSFGSLAQFEAYEADFTLKAVEILFHSPNYSEGSTMRQGALYRRAFFSDVENLPFGAYVRSSDRFTPNGTEDATQGGYWIFNSPKVRPSYFGARGDQVTNDTTHLLTAEAVASALSKAVEIELPYAKSGAVDFTKSGVLWEFVGGWVQLTDDTAVTWSGDNVILQNLTVDGLAVGSTDPFTGVAVAVSGEKVSITNVSVNNHNGLHVDVEATAIDVTVQTVAAQSIRISNSAIGCKVIGEDRDFSKPPIYWAHRGLGGSTSYAVQNTMMAFTGASRAGFKHLELDVRVANGISWVFHDTDVSSLTNGTGDFETLTTTQIEALRFTKVVGADMSDGITVPRLSEFLEWAKLDRPFLHVELKAVANGNSDIDLILAEIEAAGMSDRTLIYTGRNLDELQYVRSQNRDVKVMLFRSTDVDFTDAEKYGLARLGNAEVLISRLDGDDAIEKAYVDGFHELGLPVNVYTINQRSVAKDSLAIGVQGIYTDRIVNGNGSNF